MMDKHRCYSCHNSFPFLFPFPFSFQFLFLSTRSAGDLEQQHDQRENQRERERQRVLEKPSLCLPYWHDDDENDDEPFLPLSHEESLPHDERPHDHQKVALYPHPNPKDLKTTTHHHSLANYFLPILPHRVVPRANPPTPVVAMVMVDEANQEEEGQNCWERIHAAIAWFILADDDG